MEQGNKYLTINLIPVFFFQREKMITFVSAMIKKTSVLCAVVGYVQEIKDAVSTKFPFHKKATDR